MDVFVSGIPHYHNLRLAKLAVRAKSSVIDFGGNTGIVRQLLALDAQARKGRVALVPDCGMGLGANVTLAVRVMGLLDEPEDVRIFDGGLPQRPKPPWNYELTFHVAGLMNEYTGTATFPRDGKRVEVPALSNPEHFVVPPLGKLEARVTSGGLSTMPWTYEGRLRVLENKTLRWPGHWDQILAFANLGLFSDQPVVVDGKKVVPREVFHALFPPRATGEGRDVAVIRVVSASVSKDPSAPVALRG